MDARVRRVENFIVLELSGRVDDFHTDVVKDELDTIVSTGRTRIAIDLAGVTALSARAVNAWLDVYERLLVSNGGLVLIGPRGAARELVDSVGLADVLPVIEDVAHLSEVRFPELSREGGVRAWNGWWRRLRGRAALLAGALVGAGSLGASPARAQVQPQAQPQPQSPVQQQTAVQPAPLTLEEAQRIARERSPLVRLSRARFQEKDADFEIARLGPLPKFSGTMGYLYQSNPNAITALVNREANSLRSGAQESSLNEIQTRNEMSIDKNAAVVGIGALQILYAGGYFDARRDLALREREQGEIEVRLSEYELDGLVRDLFVGIILLEDKVKLQEARQQGFLARLDALRQAAASRAVGESQVNEAEIDVLKGRREMREAQGDLESRQKQFNALLGRPDGSRVDLRLPAASTLGNVATRQPLEAALARNPVVAQGLKRIATAESYVRLVRSQEMFVPKAFAFGGVDHTQGLGNKARFVNWSLGVGLVVPLFDGGVQAEETRKALALRSQAEYGYEIEVAKLKEQTSDAELRLDLAREGYELAQKALGFASKGVQEAADAAANAQLPKFKLEEIRVKKIEAELALLAARAEVLRWQSIIASLAGEGS